MKEDKPYLVKHNSTHKAMFTLLSTTLKFSKSLLRHTVVTSEVLGTCV